MNQGLKYFSTLEYAETYIDHPLLQNFKHKKNLIKNK